MEPQLSQTAHNPLRVGMLGIGTVGSGTCRVLRRNRKLIGARAGRDIELRAVSSRTLARATGIIDPEVALIADPQQLVRHPDIDVIVETIGGTTAARDLVLEAIAHGKHVVTANKALLALHGNEIFAAADARGVCVAYAPLRSAFRSSRRCARGSRQTGSTGWLVSSTAPATSF